MLINSTIDLIVFILSSISFRWLLFEYKKFQFFRDILDKSILAELNQCVFCQSFEAGLITLLLYRFSPVNVNFFFLPLICGFLGMIFYPIIDNQISRLEEINHFRLTTDKEQK